MKNIVLLILVAVLYVQCGSSKKNVEAEEKAESTEITESGTQEPTVTKSTPQEPAPAAIPQDVTTVTAKTEDISDNLDLEAVAAVFGESKDLEDFEKRLNDPEAKISNLDMNGDGEVDYLRVVENSEKDTHVISIQAVIGKDQFQDVATVDIDKNDKGETTVQVVGDVYMYGTNYVITPTYTTPPVVVTYIYAPVYVPYYSPYYWGYYPPYYNPWRTIAIHHYRTHAYAHAHHHHHHHYHHTSDRVSHHAENIQNKNRRNDYATTQPQNSFENRNEGVSNKRDLSNRAATTQNSKGTTNNNKSTRQSDRSGATTTGRKTNNNWKSSSNGRVHQSPRPSTRPSTPNSRPSTGPSAPSRNPSTRPSYPSSRPSTRPSSSYPSSRPSTRPSYNYSRPSTRSYSPSTRSMGGRRR